MKKVHDEIFRKLFKSTKIEDFSPEERGAYEDSLKYYRDLKNVVDTSREEGREEGRKEGREEGIHQKQIQIALEMKEGGEPIDKIMQYTGLSKEEIESL